MKSQHRRRHVRSIFSKIGSVDRIWLEPEDAESRKCRTKAGGSRRKRSKYGWIEFLDEEKAKLAVDLLNNQPIGYSLGSRRKPFSEDLWSLRYLKGFKWYHLVEEKALEWKHKNRRLNLELSQMARERDFYLSRVECANVVAKIKKRKVKKSQFNADISVSNEQSSSLSLCPYATALSEDNSTKASTTVKTSHSEESAVQCHSSKNSNIEGVMQKIFCPHN
ncbi:Pre-rRNA-processing protein esf-2 [Galdieria sulphuraria]|nr:Pre-rRNA-processing protein esf-2 [Galdieria sulphuraria]